MDIYLFCLCKRIPVFSILCIQLQRIRAPYASSFKNDLDTSSWARSVADIDDHGLLILSVVSSPDELIVGRFFSRYQVIQTACVFCVLSSFAFGHKPFHSIFAFLIHQLHLYAKKNCSCLFMMVLSRDLLYPAISITSLIDFFSAHGILIILLMYHISAASSLLSRSFVSGPYLGFQRVDFGVSSVISVGEDGLHLGGCH